MSLDRTLYCFWIGVPINSPSHSYPFSILPFTDQSFEPFILWYLASCGRGSFTRISNCYHHLAIPNCQYQRCKPSDLLCPKVEILRACLLHRHCQPSLVVKNVKGKDATVNFCHQPSSSLTLVWRAKLWCVKFCCGTKQPLRYNPQV